MKKPIKKSNISKTRTTKNNVSKTHAIKNNISKTHATKSNISATYVIPGIINLDDLHGAIPVRMSNDYLFRALMQTNTKVLKSLICALLHLDHDEVASVTLLNPIELGKKIDEKNYILDIKVDLNGQATINLEMQVINEGNWPERSLCYLCRVFDRLNRGEDYEDLRPAIQIGLLDFTLFEDSPEFFANYYLMNEKNHRIYSDKFRLSVLDLTRIDLATREDRDYQIDSWAAVFKATTWEELKMLAENNQDIEDAVVTICQLTQEEKIRQQCEAREDYYRRTAGREKRLKQTTQERDELKEQLSQKEAEIAKKDADIAMKDDEIAKNHADIAKKDADIAKKDDEIAKNHAEIAKKEAEIEHLRSLLANSDNSKK